MKNINFVKFVYSSIRQLYTVVTAYNHNATWEGGLQEFNQNF